MIHAMVSPARIGVVAAAILAIAVVALVAKYTLGADPGGEDDAGIAAPPTAGSPDDEEADAPEVLPGPEDRVVAPGETGAAADETTTDSEAGWRACLEETDAARVTACLEACLPAEGLGPEELAALLCAEESEIDNEEKWLVAVAAARWAPREVFANVAELHERCEDLGYFWVGFFDDRLAHDPAWHEAAFAALQSEHLCDGTESTAILELVSKRAAGGDAWMQGMLQAAARGELGGSDVQVAFALDQAMDCELDAGGRLAFLDSVLGSPSFGGRPFATDALMGALLDPRTVEPGHEAEALALTRRLLEDPVRGARAARHLLVLNEWETLPANYSPDELAELVDLARKVTPPDEEDG